MPSFKAHPSMTVSETRSTDNKYYRFSKFQQSPPPSALMELDINVNKGVAIVEARNATPKLLCHEMSPPFHGHYQLQRGKPRRFKAPTKRTVVDKPTREAGCQFPYALKSLSLWVAYLLLSFISSGGASAEKYSKAVREAGDLIYLEICRLNLSNYVVVASLWYARQSISEPLAEVHDVPAVLHHLFLLSACMARGNISDPLLPIEIWTRCLGRNAVDFRALVKAAIVALDPNFVIGKQQWRDWLDCLYREASDHYPYDNFAQRAVQYVLEGLAGH